MQLSFVEGIHVSPRDTLDLTQSSTEPSVVIEDVAGDDDDDEDETPAHDRSAHPR